jgi:hypothetical protein
MMTVSRKLWSLGSTEYKQASSERGAEALKRCLVGHGILKDRLLTLMRERYDEAVMNFIQAKKSFEAQGFKSGIQAALKDLTLAYRFPEDSEKAEQCRVQLKGLIKP